jgi:hypothetical protein
MLNLAEYRAGTDPQDAASRLWLRIESEAAVIRLGFAAQSIKSYTVQHQASLGTNWLPLASYTATPVNRSITLTNAPTGETRFYRVITPADP